MNQNKILTTLNQPLNVQLYSLQGVAGPQTYTTLDGVPLGTSDGSSIGEIGLKVVIIGNTTPDSPELNSGLPYNADEQVITYVTAGPATITYKKAGDTIAVRTFTYENSGASSSDRVLTSIDV